MLFGADKLFFEMEVVNFYDKYLSLPAYKE